MSEWEKVKIGDFLTEREGRFKPDDKRISKYQRLDKIDFSGNIHLSNKPTKTDMILVQPGDLVISGINVAKGAITVYQGEEPVCATIHYSSYTFDSSKVDLDYFKFFVKSAAFIAAMQKQVKGGIKTEIKPKHLLALEISIPDLGTQKKIVKEISSQLEKTEQLSSEIEKQKSYAKQLHQNILQEAIEGKITADWRKQHPVQKGNPDYDAEALFEKIQAEKSETQSSKKTVAPITKDEIPFEIPIGWKWVRLGEITSLITDGKHGDSVNQSDSGYYFLSAKDIQNGELVYSNARQITKKDFDETHRRTNLEPGDICMVNTGATIGKLALAPDNPKTYKTTFQKSVAVIKLYKNIYNKYVKFFLEYDVSELMAKSWGSAINNLLLSDMRLEMISLPPLAEQKEIVVRVEKHLQTITQLETQIATRETTTKQLMQSILKDAFEED